MVSALIALLVWSVTIILLIVGLIIIFIGLPGIWLVFLGILLNAAWMGFEEVSGVWIGIFFLLTLVASLIDNLLIPLGSKFSGGSKWGVFGAIVGAIVGLLVGNIVGVIVGPFIGAVGFELMLAKKDTKAALRSGFGTFIGFVVSVLAKFAVAVCIISIWTYLLIF